MIRLIKSFSIYTVSNFLEQGVGFLLLPIFTFYLSPEDYGTLALFTVYISILTKIITFGSTNAVAVEYFKIEKQDFPSYFSSALIIPVLIFFLFLILSFSLSSDLEGILSIDKNWIFTIPLISIFTMFLQFLKTFYRVNDYASKFAFLNVSNITLNLTISLLFIVVFGMNWQGRALGIAITALVYFILSIAILRKYKLINVKLSKNHIRDAAMTGGPIVFHALGGFIINFSDKIFIEKLVGTADLGVYNIGYKLSSIIFVFTSAFQAAFSPYVHKSLKQNKEKLRLQIVRISYIFIFALIILGILLVVSSPLIFRFIIGRAFADGIVYVPYVVLGYIFHGCYSIFSIYVFYTKKTYILSVLSILNIVLNLILNYILILKFQALGAAYATIVSYFVFFIVIAIISNKIYPMPWLKKKLFKFD